MNNKLVSTIKNFLSERKNRSREHQLIQKIENGFRNDEFKMHLQFIVDNKTKQIASAEALSRWETSLGELIFPGDYIGVMEKSGLIVTFDYYMFEKVCQKLSDWAHSEFAEVTISCNITRITISEKDFADKIQEIVEKYAFDRSRLIIEITEDSLEKNVKVASENILKVKELGFSVAIDDIGSGYASLMSLCEYPIDMVKVDRSLLLLAAKDRGRKLFFGIVSFMHGLGFKVICEGVETEEQNALVVESGCDYTQGWYYTKAMPEKKAEEFYKEYMSKL